MAANEELSLTKPNRRFERLARAVLPENGRIGTRDLKSREGPDRDYLYSAIFGDDFFGKSLLDIGSRAGDVCLEALKRGGGRALGVEVDPENVQLARLRSEAVGLPAEFLCEDFEKLDGRGFTFDVVSCLSVFHHMYDPVGVLRRMMTIAQEKLVIEFAMPGSIDSVLGALRPARLLARERPIILLRDPKKQVRALDRSFLFTKGSFRVLINLQSSLFDPLEFHNSRLKNRAVLVARKRRIGECLVVAGPTSSGKTTLIEDIANARGRGLDLPDAVCDWPLLRDLERTVIGMTGKCVLHFDILRPFRRGMRTIERDPAVEILTVCDRLRVVTLMPPPAQLRRQFEVALSAERRPDERQRKIEEGYGRSGFLKAFYARWFACLERLAPRIVSSEILVDGGGSHRVAPASRWQQVFAELHGGDSHWRDL